VSHELRVGVAPAAKLGDLSANGLAQIAFGRVHRRQAGDRRVTAVASDAPETLGRVHISAEVLRGVGQPGIGKDLVARYAGWLLGSLRLDERWEG
jgi:hypothetical protein